MFVAFTKYWGDYEPPDNHPKTFVNMFNALLSYLEIYPPATDKIQPFRGADGTPAVEYTFAIPLPILHPDTGEQILYAGRFDMIGEMVKDLWIVDEKTTKGFGPQWSDQWALRSQFIGYTWACRLYDYPYLQGAIIRGIAILKRSFDHREAIVPIHQWQVDRWEQQMLRRVQQMVDAYTSGVWDMAYADACTWYGGCTFQMLCGSPNPVIWYDHYTERLWNPLHKDPSDGED